MHTVRSAARRSAWSNDGRNYNPYCRTRKRSSQLRGLTDEEGGMQPPTAQTWPQTARDQERPRTGNQQQLEGLSREPAFPESSEPASATTAVERVPTTELEEKKDIPEDISSGEVAVGGEMNGRPSEGGEATRRRKKWLGLKKTGDERPTLAHRSSSAHSGKSKKFPKHIPLGQQIRAVLFPQWLTINWLLFCVPVGISIANVGHSIPPIAVFVVNFVAIIPLAAILSYATEEIALRVGETLGGLLNASFG